MQGSLRFDFVLPAERHPRYDVWPVLVIVGIFLETRWTVFWIEPLELRVQVGITIVPNNRTYSQSDSDFSQSLRIWCASVEGNLPSSSFAFWDFIPTSSFGGTLKIEEVKAINSIR